MRSPQSNWRIPAETQHKAQIRAAQLKMRPGQYVASLIEEDCKKDLENSVAKKAEV